MPDFEACPIQNLEEEKIGEPTQLTLLKGQLYPFHAYHFGEAIRLKEIAKLFDLKPVLLNPTCLIYEVSAKYYCLFYNFGTVIFFNAPEAVQQNTLQRVKSSLRIEKELVAADEFWLEEESQAPTQVSFDKVVVNRISKENIEILALVLAQSTALDHFEKKVEAMLGKLGEVLATLGKKQRVGERKIVHLIEEVMNTKQDLVATLLLLEKPEETWEDKTLDDLHQEAVMMFELKERFRTLDYKLKTIQENLGILSNFVTNRQHLFLEATIVALIVVEVVLFCYDLFLK